MKHENDSFIGSQVNLDGNEYQGCVFRNCTLVYSGGKPPSFINCSFDGIRLNFVGSAGDTLGFLAALYKGGLEFEVESTFDAIRGESRERTGSLY